MARYVRLGELLIGTEGAALFRHVLDGDDEFVRARIEAIRALLAELDDGPLAAMGVEVPELDVAAGYAAWAPVYDSMENALISAEEPIVERALSDVEPGVALDAGCGTGRHAARLVAAGHRTIGVDATDAMLEVARKKVPDAEFRVGDMADLPLDDASVDVAVCSLALTHLADPSPAIAELARVVRPGGRVVISDAHPTFVAIQGQALFPVPDGFAFVRNHVHWHSTYLSAFAKTGLSVRWVADEPMEMDFTKGMTARSAEAAKALWAGIPIALVWALDRVEA